MFKGIQNFCCAMPVFGVFDIEIYAYWHTGFQNKLYGSPAGTLQNLYANLVLLFFVGVTTVP